MKNTCEEIEGKVIVKAEYHSNKEKFTIYLDNGCVLHFAATDQGKLYIVLDRKADTAKEKEE